MLVTQLKNFFAVSSFYCTKNKLTTFLWTNVGERLYGGNEEENPSAYWGEKEKFLAPSKNVKRIFWGGIRDCLYKYFFPFGMCHEQNHSGEWQREYNLMWVVKLESHEIYAIDYPWWGEIFRLLFSLSARFWVETKHAGWLFTFFQSIEILLGEHMEELEKCSTFFSFNYP